MFPFSNVTNRYTLSCLNFTTWQFLVHISQRRCKWLSNIEHRLLNSGLQRNSLHFSKAVSISRFWFIPNLYHTDLSYSKHAVIHPVLTWNYCFPTTSFREFCISIFSSTKYSFGSFSVLSWHTNIDDLTIENYLINVKSSIFNSLLLKDTTLEAIFRTSTFSNSRNTAIKIQTSNISFYIKWICRWYFNLCACCMAQAGICFHFRFTAMNFYICNKKDLITNM